MIIILTYDSVWTTFRDNFKTLDMDVPTDEIEIYKTIKNAVLLFNNKFRTEAKANDSLEIIEGLKEGDDALILALYIKLTILNNTRTFYEHLLQGYDGDVGFKNFSSQLVSVRENITNTMLQLDTVIFNTKETFL